MHSTPVSSYSACADHSFPQRPQAPASASAHKAATQAFLASQTSHGNLSASAAAAALRSMTPTPTQVEHVQTKRTVQRQSSLGPVSGAGRGRSRGGLQRQSSAGSMTERTFRTPSPSPSRPASRAKLVEHPPLPNIPQQYASNTTVQGKKKVRSASQGPPPPRVLSPPLTRPGARGQSLDRSRQPEQPTQAARKKNLAPVNEIERTDSSNSINFSRPLSPRPQSPGGQSLSLSNGEHASASLLTKSISPAKAEDIQYGLLETANHPVKKKKKKAVPGAAEGSHLQGGTMASRPVVTPLEPGPEEEFEGSEEQLAPVKKKKKKKTVAVAVEPSAQPAPSDTSSRADSDSDSGVAGARERRASRASGMLMKQPSIVREDWEGEQNEGISPRGIQQPSEDTLDSVNGGQTPQSKRAGNAANVSRKIEEPTVPPKTVNQLVTSSSNMQDGRATSPDTSGNLQVVDRKPTRGTSLSPSRSTRFSDRLSSDLAAGQKHEPPPRSVSPAKPALKHHSPAPGRSVNDPYARGSSVTPSEASDISSISADGTSRRKKSARVSFDSQPEIVGAAPTAASWVPVGRNKPALNTITSNDDMDDLMKPRPQLPSFGSIRGQNPPDTNEQTAASVLRSSASPTGSDNNAYETKGVSSDHAVGAILAQQAQESSHAQFKPQSVEPLPPQVTSVEGQVSFSESESESSEDEETSSSGVSPEKDEAPRHTEHNDEQSSAVVQQPTSTAQSAPQSELPTLSLSPPTPALEQGRSDDDWVVDVPGGFPDYNETTASSEASKGKAPSGAENATASTGLGVDSTSDESASDNDSIYSDAAEDPSELDGTGFGSIDAIVDSPIVSRPTALATIPESPPARTADLQPPEPVRTASWEEAQARWTHILEQTRQGPPSGAPVYNQVTQQQGRQEFSQQPAKPQVSEPRRKKKTQAAIAAAASAPGMAAAGQSPTVSPARRRKKQAAAHSAVDQPNSAAAAAAAAAPYRQSMRASPAPEPEAGFRKSMRSPNHHFAPDSAPRPQQRRPPQAASSGMAQQPRGALQKKHIPAAAATVTPATALAQRLPPVPVAMTNDSDSDSSFRKRRRRRAVTESQHTMRRSMRGATDPTMRDNGRSQIRSLSPEGRRPFSAGGSRTTMRTSMRGSMDSGVPSLRPSIETKRPSSLFGRGQKSPQLVPLAGPTQKHRSRTADSDDEDDVPRMSKFRSRFGDDSDDEPDTTRFTPVRGIPRRGNDSDSTDLEDSSEDEKRPAQAPLRLQIPSNGAPVPGEEPLSPNTEKKRGLFGMFRGKKHKDDASSIVADSPPRAPKMDASKPSQLGFASAAERDRIIEQTRAKLEAAKDQDLTQSPQTHGKLQRRHQAHRMMSDSWPLPPNLPADSGKIRPSTSDGAPFRNGSARLNQGSMRAKEPLPPIGRSGKKKKFPMLRKAFGLKD
ncbi:hypothetical protein A1O1_04153 [Capronia coronata CBS 617.96]|uniref:Uncharacterized protein n=1 Tax=Capronia coronata CBS 617.96 TaxID=1182541 RepID=W9YP82_9EURO|nr:uncharacterized protein A1O1_04153 [Capronia coronata CBS 617.96]EXJ91046.1 hypothetical protein A1O1_04153 [Capronia coronata CBS 617.96]